ncbi:UNVERIFIED_CONTAM: hypothetical protein GTU68_042782 [Idotea baltica]|nr:hypothetical protein [Idotea baltica]
MLRTAFCPIIRAALDSPDTIEVMANADGGIWIETAGKGVSKADLTVSAEDRERVIRLVASGAIAKADHTSPIVSAELPETGERFEGCLPPVSTAPCFSIRKPATTPFSLSDYVQQGALSPPLHDALLKAAAARDNIVIAGGTSSGKTTFTNALLADPVFEDDRILILEDTRELRCQAPNALALRTQAGRVTLKDLVRSTLRLRPDRIIVGEVRGAEALDLLKAWNTGHPGGITTLHAGSAKAALTRIEQLCLEAMPHPPSDLIAEAVDVILYMDRGGGQRRVVEALRVTGFDGQSYLTEPLIGGQLSLVTQGDMK